jgi:DNA-binding NtrC family response regulator
MIFQACDAGGERGVIRGGGLRLDTLLAMLDACDPYGPGLTGSDLWAGPTLSVLSLRTFDAVVLMGGHADEDRLHATAQVIAKKYPTCAVEIIRLPAVDPVGVLAWVTEWYTRRTGPGGHVTACVNAGPSDVRGVWLALAAARPGELNLVEVIAPRYITDEPVRLNEWPSPAPARRGASMREPAVAYRVETQPEAFERAWLGRDLGRAGSSPPSLEQALQQLGLCGEHPAFRRAVETAATVAPHKVPVLLGGETGSGKGALARLIHLLSGRPADRWVPLNCAALPESLAESILFGHKKGSFTGAAVDQVGKFEVADRGTLFLDEIGELPLTLQAKLLKVLEDGVVEPVGARQGKAVDVRVIAATNRDLKVAVADKKFREDLFYRLSFAQIQMPPLRERRADIHHLALRMVAKLNVSLHRPRRLAPSALERLEQHDWPGNIRDLENVIGRSLLLSTRDALEAADLIFDAPGTPQADPLQKLPTPHEGFSLDAYLSDARRQLILRALQLADGNQSAAARLLDLSPQAVHKFLRDA